MTTGARGEERKSFTEVKEDGRVETEEDEALIQEKRKTNKKQSKQGVKSGSSSGK